MRVEDTFVTTTPKTALTAELDSASAELVRTTTMKAITIAQRTFPPHIAAQAGEWPAGDHLYTLTPPVSRPRLRPRPGSPATRRVEVAFVPGQNGLRRRNLLVTNAEFAAFLDEMAAAGLPDSRPGTCLLCREMSHERGGRPHHDLTGRWMAGPGFERL
ncbi:hypothetical protein HTZ77_24465 [Nonomuraea sp. SMC257]|uniref:Uncharacterized protein n=1 Tax=Nonomuraea montanisoli TaxID=2741721 RepID=A0A7Y6IA96_9ACTN|nr:hypothetical protein [Nonomuraea montanisoli]NUW34567.1 hypothetical protein [Nonomuraea montanisoli]